MKDLKSSFVLGILGSGQLARMSANAASDLGIQTKIFCTEENISPAESVATSTYKGSFKDKTAVLEFVKSCDIVTLENEFIDQEILEAIDNQYPGKLFPSSKTFRMIGDKLTEKKSFEEAGLKVVPYQKINVKDEIITFAKTYNYPVVLKSTKGGYDGYGNVTIKNADEIDAKFHLLKGELLAEAFIPFEKELAVMIARNESGDIKVYPVAHTIQENHICHFVSVPAQIHKEVEEKIVAAAMTAMKYIDAVGIFAFEFFLTKDNDLYLNESAPRPHNSGHYTMEACVTSQFHNHIRSVLNLPLGETTLKTPHALMLNLLGTQTGPAQLSMAKDFMNVTDGHLHLYGKLNSKPGRKMGHFTLLGSNPERMMSTLKKLKESYSL